jgi:uncharacterized protein YjiS (DUF1127 family)
MSTQLSAATRFEWSTSRDEPASLWSRLNGISTLVAVWRERRWYRKELRRLASDGSHLVDDVGLKPSELQAEIAKPFWQA